MIRIGKREFAMIVIAGILGNFAYACAVRAYKELKA